MADHFEFRTSKSAAGDTVPVEDFTFGYEEIKSSYSKSGMGFTRDADDHSQAAGNFPYEEIKVKYPTLDPKQSQDDMFIDDVFSF